MDLQLIALGLAVGNFVLTWGLAFYMHLVNKSKVTEDRMSRLEAEIKKALDELAVRQARIEQDTKHAPTHEDLKSIHRRIDEVKAAVSHLQGEFAGANKTLGLIHDYLLNKKD